MWVNRYLTKETRTHVPKFKTFLRNNQDLLKLWYEDVNSVLEERIAFPMRVIRFMCSAAILFIACYAIVDPQGSYY